MCFNLMTNRIYKTKLLLKLVNGPWKEIANNTSISQFCISLPLKKIKIRITSQVSRIQIFFVHPLNQSVKIITISIITWRREKEQANQYPKENQIITLYITMAYDIWKQLNKNQSHMLSGNWKFWDPNIWWEVLWTKTATLHLLPLKPSQRGKLTVPDKVFFADMSFTVQSFSSFLTTKSLDKTRPLFSPLVQSVTNPLSYKATITLAPWLSTLLLKAPVKETCKESDEGLWKVACSIQKMVTRAFNFIYLFI